MTLLPEDPCFPSLCQAKLTGLMAVVLYIMDRYEWSQSRYIKREEACFTKCQTIPLSVNTINSQNEMNSLEIVHN